MFCGETDAIMHGRSIVITLPSTDAHSGAIQETTAVDRFSDPVLPATWQPSAWATRVLLALSIVHLMMLGWCAHHDSFCWDEVAHLPAGLFHWEHGQFGMFRVNPPLVRMVGTFPLLAFDYKTDWSDYTEDIMERPEWPVSERFLRLNGERSFWLLTVARWACLPFSLLGLWICWRWAGELFGDWSAVLAATMWCFSPNVLGHGHLISPDLASAAIGIAAFYAFRHWLLSPTWPNALIAGIAFGQAQATKTSWLILFGVWPLLWLMWRQSYANAQHRLSLSRDLLKLAIILFLGVLSINFWYGYEGTFTPLGDFQFLSKSLGGGMDDEGNEVPGNRFAATWLASVPVPLPRQYVQGIDRQKSHFERPDQSYLRGEWRDRGWWHYYAYAALVKEPIGYWLLGGLATVLCCTSRAYRSRWREEALLLIPLILIVLFVSSQRGFNRHLRYILPAFPFAFILASRVARSIDLHMPKLTIGMAVCTTWAVLSSLLIFPHSLGYFNELAGGPENGHNHLLSSNTDWGQDLHYLKSWVDAHPEARPLHLKWHTRVIDVGLVGLTPLEIPGSPQPGWHAISVNSLRGRGGKYAYLLETDPVAMAGYSIFIYHLTDDDCRKIKVQLRQKKKLQITSEKA
jgi:hypothetical protein